MKTVVDNETTPPDELPDAALAATEDVADSDAPTAQENAPTEEAPKAPYLVLVDYLRGCSANGTVVDRRELLAPPYALTEEELDVLLMQIRTE